MTDGKTLAGSAITMLDAFHNLVSLGLSLAEASDMCSTRQAEYLGLNHLGRIVPGANASVVAMDDKLALQSIWVEGQKLNGGMNDGSTTRRFAY